MLRTSPKENQKRTKARRAFQKLEIKTTSAMENFTIKQKESRRRVKAVCRYSAAEFLHNLNYSNTATYQQVIDRRRTNECSADVLQMRLDTIETTQTKRQRGQARKNRRW